MKPESHAAGIPDLLLERYRLDELSPAERAQVERGLRDDETLRRRLDAIERSDKEFCESGFPARLAKQVQSRTASGGRTAPARDASRGPGGRVASWALPVAVGVSAVLLVLIGSSIDGPGGDSAGDRIKGLRPALTVFRQTPAGSETLADGAAAREGDVVRVAYQAAGRSYGAILSIDGRGEVTVHLPATGDRAVRLRPGDRVLLDHAYELDAAPRWECFYFVTAQAPFEMAPIVEAARRAAASTHASPPPALALPRGLEQSTFSLQKEHKP